LLKIALTLSSALLLGAIGAHAQDFPENQPNPRVVLTNVPSTDFGNMGMGFLSDGRMVLLSNGTIALTSQSDLGGGDIQNPTATRDFAVYLISGLSAKGALTSVTATKILDQLTGPPPGIVVVNDTVYVMDRTAFYRINSLAPTGGISKAQNATRLIDIPALDSTFTWNRGPSGHQWMFTPQYHNGRFYAAYSGSIRRPAASGVPQSNTLSGAVLSWKRDSVVGPYASTSAPQNNKGYRIEAGGLRSPNGIATNGQYMLHSDNQGSFTPGTPVRLFKPGQSMVTYGHRQGTLENRGGGSISDVSPNSNNTDAANANTARNWAEDLPYQPPVMWIPFSPFRSASQPVYLTFGPYAGQWLLGDVNGIGMGRLWVDDVDSSGKHQASFTLFSGGALNKFGITGSGNAANRAVNRMIVSPDSALYIGSIYRRDGNWSSGATAPVMRVTFKDTSIFEIMAVRSRKSADGSANGIEIFFSEPVDSSTVSAGSFTLTQNMYSLGAAYGCGTSCGSKNLTASAVSLSADRRRAFVTIATPDTSVGAAHIGTLGVGNNPRGVWGGPGKQDRTVRVTINAAVRSASGASLYYNIAWMGWFYQSTRTFKPNVVENLNVSIAGSRVHLLASAISIRPSAGMLSVNVDLPGRFTVGLYTVNGALKQQQTGSAGAFRFETGTLGRGVHILRVRQTDGTVHSRPFML
jgi:hypothetical protein